MIPSLMNVYLRFVIMRAKGNVGVISSIILETIRIHKLEHCHGHKSNESLFLGDDHIHIMMTLSMVTMMKMKKVTLTMRRL